MRKWTKLNMEGAGIPDGMDSMCDSIKKESVCSGTCKADKLEYVLQSIAGHMITPYVKGLKAVHDTINVVSSKIHAALHGHDVRHKSYMTIPWDNSAQIVSIGAVIKKENSICISISSNIQYTAIKLKASMEWQEKGQYVEWHAKIVEEENSVMKELSMEEAIAKSSLIGYFRLFPDGSKSLIQEEIDKEHIVHLYNDFDGSIGIVSHT